MVFVVWFFDSFPFHLLWSGLLLGFFFFWFFSELSGNSNLGLQMCSLENAWQDKEKARQKESA